MRWLWSKTVTAAIISVDTEYSALLHQRGASAADNFAASIDGVTRHGDFGIGWQMDLLDRYGLTGVYFVDPMPALVHGVGAIAAIVEPVLRRGHDVQLHLHSEWLAFADTAPVAARGTNIADFGLDDQVTLIGWAKDMLMRAGAPAPTAFRAGNFGANDDTLRALAAHGIGWDSSFNAVHRRRRHGPCSISLDDDCIDPAAHCGVMELPVATLWDRPGSLRPAQVCALSASEMRAALDHAAATERPAFMTVSHSFEMLSRDRSRPNHMVMARFDAMCRAIAEHPGLATSSFAALDLMPAAAPPQRLGPSHLRTLARMAEQAWGTWRYERRLRPV